ncbi:MAG: preprotein translocase subunit YajC [Clostridia bacterium]|nr:preprotein translocase subunit YajC [Clostridia bacterium]
MNMLAIVSDTTSSPWMTLIWVVVIVALFVGMMFVNRRSQKKRQEEADKMLNAIKPGNKVKTIGGICGIVVEVCPDDNTFVLETGTENSGKSYIKFDRQAIYQTDAVVEEQPVKEEPVEEKPAEETSVEETPAAEENKENE